MELTAYIRLARRWWWLAFLAAFLAGSAAYLRSSRQPTQYRAQVTLAVGSFISDPNPEGGVISTGEKLAQTYVVLAEKNVVLQGAIDSGNLPVSAGQLAGALRARVVPDTTLIELTVTHTDQILAVDMADQVAQRLILNSPSNLTPEQQAQIDLANTEIDRLNDQLEQGRLRLAELDTEMQNTTDPDELARLTEQHDTVINQINQASANLATFSETVSRLQQRANSLDIVEPARALGPIPQNTMQTTILAAMVGAALAVGVALLIEYLDDSLKTVEQISAALSLPTLAVIPKFGKRKDSYADRLITYRQPDSPISEEYRTLRTNVMFSANGSKAIFIVTSPGPSEGKTVTAANLAVSLASAGWRVLLVDADLRRPKLHQVFELDNRKGLSTLLTVDVNDIDWDNQDLLSLPPHLAECIHEVNVPGLAVIPSGEIPLNPSEVLGSGAMQNWIGKIRAAQGIDIIIFDTPPALVAADSAVLASLFEIPVLLVIEAGRTRPGAALHAKERLTSLDVNIAGVVLNSVRRRDQGYDYGYGYYYYYYYKDKGSEPRSPLSDRPHERTR